MLVCTTIIETGVDVPNVNTLIIENADRLGLSQLHQLRGRVGRSSRAGLRVPDLPCGARCSPTWRPSGWTAIREFTEFGAGFKIAMRDMEIRGAGNLLGAQQHGHMEAVGIRDVPAGCWPRRWASRKGETAGRPGGGMPHRPADCRPISRSRYIAANAQRLDVYRRIADIRTHEDSLRRVRRADRPLRRAAGGGAGADRRGAAAQHGAPTLGIYEVKQQQDSLLLYQRKLDLEVGARMSAAMKGRVMVSAGAKPYFAVKIGRNLTPLDTLREALEAGTPEEKKGN